MGNMSQYEEARFYFTVMEFAEIARQDPDTTFNELESCCPEIYDLLVAHFGNNELRGMK